MLLWKVADVNLNNEYSLVLRATEIIWKLTLEVLYVDIL